MLKFFRKRMNQNGFTLIELIVVIAILGILATIAVPRLSGFRNQAQSAANEATARTIASQVTMIEAEAGANFDPTASFTFEVGGNMTHKAKLDSMLDVDIADTAAAGTWGVAARAADGTLTVTPPTDSADQTTYTY